MAIMSSTSHPLCIHKLVSTSKHVNKAMMVTGSHVSANKTSSIKIKSSSSSVNNKIFEDKSRGILCYIDENGEVTCEGTDEGPRIIHHQLPSKNYHERDVEVIELLQKNWLQIADVNAEDGEDGLERRGLNWNGFNTLC